jgi:erythrin-vacuolar iron transport family protein
MATRGIDFEKLALRDALDLAILIEEEAKERYEEFTAQMESHHTPEAASFFRFMVGNEAKHEAELEARRAMLFGDSPRTVTRAMIYDVEAPDYDEARAFMSPHAALKAAFRCEEKAHDFFVAALPRIQDPDVKALFEELRDEEIEHQKLILKQIAKLPPEGGTRPDDWVDDPVAQ